MSDFRGSDEQLDREIETLERMARLRLRRASSDLNEIERDLRELRRTRARRRERVAGETVIAERPTAAEPIGP
jgi:hypothetical protein